MFRIYHDGFCKEWYIFYDSYNFDLILYDRKCSFKLNLYEDHNIKIILIFTPSQFPKEVRLLQS